jgi:hypothetical protein
MDARHNEGSAAAASMGSSKKFRRVMKRILESCLEWGRVDAAWRSDGLAYSTCDGIVAAKFILLMTAPLT